MISNADSMVETYWFRHIRVKAYKRPQLSGLVVLAVVVVLLPHASPTMRHLAWGAVAGIAIGAGIGLLYRALAIGRMAVVAPTTAVCAVAIPLIGAIALGERPGPRILAGIALAIVAIVLVSQARERIAQVNVLPRPVPALGWRSWPASASGCSSSRWRRRHRRQACGPCSSLGSRPWCLLACRRWRSGDRCGWPRRLPRSPLRAA